MNYSLPTSLASSATCSFLRTSCYYSLFFSAFTPHLTILSSTNVLWSPPVPGPLNLFSRHRTYFLTVKILLFSLTHPSVFSSNISSLGSLPRYYRHLTLSLLSLFTVCNDMLQSFISAWGQGYHLPCWSWNLWWLTECKRYIISRDIKKIYSGKLL